MSVEPVTGRVVQEPSGDDECETLGLDALDLLAAAGPVGQGPARSGATRSQGPRRRVGRRVCRGRRPWLTQHLKYAQHTWGILSLSFAQTFGHSGIIFTTCYKIESSVYRTLCRKSTQY